MAATTAKTPVNRTATIGLDDVRLEDVTSAATKVGAPTSARVATGGSVPKNGTENPEYFAYSVTFSWSEEV